MEDLQQSLAVDLVAGSGLTALLAVAARDPGPGLAAAGCALGCLLAQFERLRSTLKCARSVLALVLSARQFFAHWEAKDPDVGAQLVAIPLFFLVCALPVGSAAEYLRHARLVSSALNAAVLVAAGVYYSTAPGSQGVSPAPATAYGAGTLAQLLTVADFAYAASPPPWQVTHGLAVSAARGAALVAVSVFPAVARGLLGGPTPLWLLALHSAAVIQAATLHACHVRTQLSSRDPQRAVMLLVAAGLCTGFAERAGDPAHASFAALAVSGAALVWWVAGKKLLERSE